MTAEFREQTREEKLWRNDVLQLKAQLLWAWVSLCHQVFVSVSSTLIHSRLVAERDRETLPLGELKDDDVALRRRWDGDAIWIDADGM